MTECLGESRSESVRRNFSNQSPFLALPPFPPVQWTQTASNTDVPRMCQGSVDHAAAGAQQPRSAQGHGQLICVQLHAQLRAPLAPEMRCLPQGPILGFNGSSTCFNISTKRSRENSANTSRLRSFSQDLSASASFVNAIAGTRSRCPGHEKKLDFVQTGHARAHDIAQDSVEKEFFLAICFTDAGKVPSIV